SELSYGSGFGAHGHGTARGRPRAPDREGENNARRQARLFGSGIVARPRGGAGGSPATAANEHGGGGRARRAQQTEHRKTAVARRALHAAADGGRARPGDRRDGRQDDRGGPTHLGQPAVGRDRQRRQDPSPPPRRH